MKFQFATNPAITNMQQYLKIIEKLNNKILELERIIEELTDNDSNSKQDERSDD